MQINFDAALKMLFDGSLFGVSKFHILMAVQCGPVVNTYALMPEDARNLRDALNKTIALYEVEHGAIPDSNKPVPSPIQL